MKVWCSVNGNTGSVVIDGSDDVSDLIRAILKSNPSLGKVDEFAVRVYPPRTDVDRLERFQPLLLDALCSSKEVSGATCQTPLLVIAPEPERVPQPPSGEESPAAKRFKKQTLDDEKFSVPDPSARAANELFGRKETKETIIKYLRACKNKEIYAFDAVSKKFAMLGASGVKGIGKTELLWQICGNWTKEALGLEAKALYVTYNGGGKAGDYCQKAEKMPEEKIDSVGHLLLVSHGVSEQVAINTPMSKAIDFIRRKMDCVNAPLVICIDEIVFLNKENKDYGNNGDKKGTTLAEEIMSKCMSLQDACDGKLIFIFTAILDSMYSGLKSLSGRVVRPLPLTMIPLQDVFQSIISEDLLALAKSQPAVHQLVLSCAGHPRATVDGLKDATGEWNHSQTISTAQLIKARSQIIDTCKFEIKYLNNDIIGQWFNLSEFPDELKTGLLSEGILHSVAGDVEFIFPLLLQEWSDRHRDGNLYGHHLSGLFDSDLILDSAAEKHMEAVMYHYEAVLRLAMKGRTFKLSKFYRSSHVAPRIANKSFRAHLPNEDPLSLVEFVENFKDMPLILGSLRDGLIVVSKAHREKGIEYLAPYKDENQELVVACVQCKFVKDGTSWPIIQEKMAVAVAGLIKAKIQHFPVVYTTADQHYIQPKTFQDGVYFIEKDLFAFTRRLGILRLHTQKLGGVLTKDYPFLKELVIDKC